LIQLQISFDSRAIALKRLAINWN